MEKLINQEHIDKVFAIGPPIMMKFCCKLTEKYNIPTDVSLNTIMVDGTGMCGACRLSIGGKTKFVCIDGPEFDGALVDWDEMLKRIGTFKEAEQKEMRHFEEHLCNNTTNTPCHATNADNRKDTKKCEDSEETLEQLIDRDSKWRTDKRKTMRNDA